MNKASKILSLTPALVMFIYQVLVGWIYDDIVSESQDKLFMSIGLAVHLIVFIWLAVRLWKIPAINNRVKFIWSLLLLVLLPVGSIIYIWAYESDFRRGITHL